MGSPEIISQSLEFPVFADTLSWTPKHVAWTDCVIVLMVSWWEKIYGYGNFIREIYRD